MDSQSNSNTKIKCAVVGTGNMGKNHVRIYSELEGVDLVGIADLNVEVGSELARKYETAFYSDYNKMIDEVKPEYVSICVPTSLHCYVASAFLEKGIHVLLEKPIAATIEDSEKLRDLAERNKVKLMIGHIERYNPVVTCAYDIVKNGEIGRITSLVSQRVGGFPAQVKDVDIAVDLAIHDIDIANYFIGELPSKTTVNKSRNHILKRPDSVELFMVYENLGVSAYVQANWITPVKIRRLVITGTDGLIAMDYLSQEIKLYKSNYDKFKETADNYNDYILRFSEPDVIDISVPKEEPLFVEINSFITQDLQHQIFNPQHAIDALRIALLD